MRLRASDITWKLRREKRRGRRNENSNATTNKEGMRNGLKQKRQRNTQKLAIQEHKLQKAIEKQRTKKLRVAETKEARKSVNQTLKRKRKIEIIPDSEPEDEIPIYSAKDLRDQRASK